MKLLLSVLLLATLLPACQSQNSGAKTNLSPDEFEKGMAQPNVQILDVRTAGEFRNGHLKNALQADWRDKNQFKDRTQHLDKAKPIYIYCLSGGRSSAAAEWLRSQGYKEVLELEGGLASWNGAGKALENAGQSPQLSEATYQEMINSAPVVLVDFGASWCPPCKKMEPVLDQLQKENAGKFKLVTVDGGNDFDIMKIQKVEALPVFIIYKNGKEVWRKQGITAKEEFQKFL